MSEGTQRRLAATVSADVVGYSRLMGADEVGTLARLRSHRAERIDPLIDKHGGRIVKTMGDGLLLEFPSVVSATQCVVEVQQGMLESNQGANPDRQILFRVGVNLGDIIVDGEDIHGDGVNIAARLQEIADPGGVAISNRVYEDVRDRLDTPFDDMGEQALKNISRPIRVWHWSPIYPSESAAEAPVVDEGSLALPDKPSIAVLPLENMSGDPEQEYFADGMTEDIITELSRFEDLFVIARNSSFAFKGQSVDVKAVARELGVQFVLEGSVRKAGQRVRITAQLIDGLDGSHIWAERYDGSLEDVFELQEEVTRQVVGSISTQISDAKMSSVERDEVVFDEAHELGWRGQEMQRKGLRLGDPAMLDRSIEIAHKALSINKKCGKAYQVICSSHMWKNLFRWGDDPTKSGQLAEEWAKKFIEQLPNSYMAYAALGGARWRNGLYQEAVRDYQRAHELNPNDAAVLRSWAVIEAGSGDVDNAEKHALMAIRLSPKDSFIHPAYLALAMAAFIQRDSAKFEEWANKAIQLAPHAPIRRAMMIAYAAEAGNLALVETHRAELMRSTPDFVSSLFRGENHIFQNPEHKKMLLDGLRKAGFTE